MFRHVTINTDPLATAIVIDIPVTSGVVVVTASVIVVEDVDDERSALEDILDGKESRWPKCSDAEKATMGLDPRLE